MNNAHDLGLRARAPERPRTGGGATDWKLKDSPPKQPGAPLSAGPARFSFGAPALFLRQREFAAMQLAFAAHGGFASGDVVADCLRKRLEQPVSVLARQIVERKLICIHWQSQILIPWVQFSRPNLSILPLAAAVMAELGSVYDDWELACWLAQDNVWLGGGKPVDAIAVGDPEVVAAARADRFIARG